jgi:hypothetical protein
VVVPDPPGTPSDPEEGKAETGRLFPSPGLVGDDHTLAEGGDHPKLLQQT